MSKKYIYNGLKNKINKILNTTDNKGFILKSEATQHSINNIKVLAKNISNIELQILINDVHILYNSDSYLFKSEVANKLNNKLITFGESVTSNLTKIYPENYNEFISTVVNVLTEHSDNSAIVGGFVRDTLLNKNTSEIKDIDFVTDIPYDILVSLFTSANLKVKEVGKQFLVLLVVDPQNSNNQIEIANYRTDINQTGRSTDVRIGSIDEDANRRDFTINALYYNLTTKEVLDPTGYGINSIMSNELKFIGNPKDRIKEDYLRVFRFYRFIGKGLIPHPKSLSTCRSMFAEAIKNTEPQRIVNEIERIVL